MSALAKKLLVKPGQTWLILNAPESYLSLLEPLPENTNLIFEAEGTPDGIQLFVKNSAELAANLKLISKILKPETVLWIIYPKKNSGIDTDLEMMGSWDELSIYSLRPVTAAAINETWTALRLKPEHLVRKSDSSKAAIKQNDYSAYINPETKQVILPNDAKTELEKNPENLAFFNKLAYSHKKEYVVWILSARQEQTRINRINKMAEMLLANKKNPSDK
ncbi:YdeI/OmpD-associated family protein [Mucilaginibacter segetis]|uniref:YdeI/OmpD-associated family protein n=1 Tax=Mucilaginibacter segetis TaxID=2793071 RepID=A0A934PXR9_9SPHI|nr:YdeI/OmpD-associated family protein [Mucilaginibacter segetis]MBK0380968.1 YdeI/OmpD-associated family protein [Mucilaginibacter segetis]